MPQAARRKPLRAPASLIFAGVAAALILLHGNRLVFSNDEGIILDAAVRMLHGEKLYRDFFGYMSPGSYWVQECAFRLFGVSLRSGRLIVILDFALECALVFWITSRLAGCKAALSTVALFFAFQASTPELLTAQHRMDSAAISLASIALCLEGRRHAKSWWWVASGAAITAAAICTPSLALFAPVTLLWLTAQRSLRRFLVPYGTGIFAGVAVILAALWAGGLLIPFVEQMAWLRRNYSAVNVMPYGTLIGGYWKPLEGASGLGWVIRCILLFCLALPAVLPIVALAGWMIVWVGRPLERPSAAEHAIPYLLGCVVVYTVTAFPRADVMHLEFVAPLSYVLVAALIARHLPRQAAAGLFLFFSVWAGMFLAHQATECRAEVPVHSPVGDLRASAADAASLERLLQLTPPGDSLYVHPYMPLLYFLTQSVNPTRFSYLAPGLMTSCEERAALADLRAKPPARILYLPLARGEFLRVFPNAGQLDHRFRALEAWMLHDYTPQPVSIAGYRLYSRIEAGVEAPATGAGR